ncbi:MAG: AMP-dependent synthetase, partial [Mesorhizobium sp.]
MMHGAVPLLHDYLTHSASRLGGKVALVCGNQRVTYGDLDMRSNAIAHNLTEAGITRGDRVVIF